MQQEHNVQAIPSTRTSPSNPIDVVHLISDPLRYRPPSLCLLYTGCSIPRQNI
jgi:hypothetical protein